MLTGLVRDVLGDRPHRAIACDVRGENGIRRLLLALAELATAGVAVDPSMLFAGRTDDIVLTDLPRPAPDWSVDGHLVRTADGSPVAGGLRPATENPTIGLGGAPAAITVGDTASQVVSDYLRNLRETVAAERDVMLQFLGSTPIGGPSIIDVTPVTVPAQTASNHVAPVPPAATELVAALPTGDGLLDRILDIVSERTGYPRDMLDPDLDLESDLSIDSIKRIEIIGELAEKIGLAGGADGGLDNDSVEKLAQLKTLRGIVEWIDTEAGGADTPTATNGTQPVGAVPTGGALLDRILDIVSERTGYPRDMLDPDLDLESDLSIDSIKRIEIIGELAEKIGLAGGADGGLDNDSVEKLAQLKTLRGIVEWIDTEAGGADIPTVPAAAAPDSSEVPPFALRAVVEAAPADDEAVVSILGAGGQCLIVDDGSGIAPALANLLRNDRLDVSVVDSQAASGVAGRAADAVIVIDLVDRGAPDVFDMLAPAALAGAKWLGCVVAAGAVGGQRGLVRALHTELPTSTLRSLTVPVGVEPATIAHWVREELNLGGPTDIRRDGGARLTRRVVTTERFARGSGPILDPGAVVLLTGGARGITARCSIELARAGAAHVHLIGRAPLPDGDEARRPQAGIR